MCQKCLLTVRPDRGSNALDDGAYVLNFAGCAACGKREPAIGTGKRVCDEEDDDDGSGDCEENVTYNHECVACKHVIAQHFYTFTVRKRVQDYTMECLLCGKGGYTAALDDDAAAELALTSAAAAARSTGMMMAGAGGGGGGGGADDADHPAAVAARDYKQQTAMRAIGNKPDAASATAAATATATAAVAVSSSAAAAAAAADTKDQKQPAAAAPAVATIANVPVTVTRDNLGPALEFTLPGARPLPAASSSSSSSSSSTAAAAADAKSSATTAASATALAVAAATGSSSGGGSSTGDDTGAVNVTALAAAELAEAAKLPQRSVGITVAVPAVAHAASDEWDS